MEPQSLQPKPVFKFNIKTMWPYVLASVVIVLAGVGSAYLISRSTFNRTLGDSTVAPGAKNTSSEAGILDPNEKYDTAEGVIVSGGLNNEGTHHLERDGGVSQNVYMTSSVIDLESFAGKKVEVWGQTMASKKVGWLMDVAKIKIVN